MPLTSAAPWMLPFCRVTGSTRSPRGSDASTAGVTAASTGISCERSSFTT